MPRPTFTDSEIEALLRRAVAQPDAPAAWVARAQAAFAARAPTGLAPAVHDFVRRIAAVLSFDSWAPAPLPAGVRGVSSPTRHLLYSTHGRDIDLRITPSAGEFAVAGQVLGPDDAGVVELRDAADASGANRLSARLDDFGEFRLEGVRRGTYRLTLRVGHDEIELPPLAVGDRPS